MIKWIKISEQWPPEDRPILITDRKLIATAFYRRFDGRACYSGYAHSGWEWDWHFPEEDITEWAELPELPND